MSIIVDGDTFGIRFVAPVKPKSGNYWEASSTVGATLAQRFLTANRNESQQIQSPWFYHGREPVYLRHLTFFPKNVKRNFSDAGKEEVLRQDERPGHPLFLRRASATTHMKVNAAVYLERDAHLGPRRAESQNIAAPVECFHYIRIDSPLPPLVEEGLAQTNQRWKRWLQRVPTSAVHATQSAIAVLGIGRLATEYPMRVNSSYEAMAVDALRWLTGLPGGDTTSGQRRNDQWLQDLFPRLKGRSNTCFAAIRLAGDAVLLYPHCSKEAPKEIPKHAFLYYNEDRPQPVRIAGYGEMTGYATILASCIAAKLSHVTKMLDCEVDGALDSAIRLGVACNQTFFTLGYCVPEKNESLSSWIAKFDYHFDEQLHRVYTMAKNSPPRIERVEIDIREACSHRKFWTILERKIAPDLSKAEREKRYFDRALALLCAKTEKQRAVTGRLPLLPYGSVSLVERFEIEDYLALHHAFLQYADEPPERPLNVAVFGPPGSGKSRGVREVAKNMVASGKKFDESPLTFNMAQLRGPEDLVNALHVVRDRCLENKIPLVFFDEFDSAFQGQPFGWLKYFLAPMEDGKFTADGHVFHLGKCVLVFAGGVNRSFAEMNGRIRNPDFCEAKGPDFISRLRASLNIHGINRSDDEDDEGRYYLRRAIILQQILAEKHEHAKTRPPVPLMSKPLAHAFLQADSFKHGVRSLRAIIEMSEFQPGQTLPPSALPPRDQLAMHVDAREFRELVGAKA